MIKILDDDTIQKIAAGEVVERPASIIKELVENSIDAKSDDIIVEIKNGGKSFIKVSDNGKGINKNEIHLAFKRYATSKIDDFNDLYKIYSMGFRGEALASIVSVSKLILKTKTDAENIGTYVEYDNNKLMSTKNIGANRGTSIEVYDLFKYIPARLKFLSSDITESNKITALMYSFAIGHPDISFTYIKDNREVFTTNKDSDLNNNYNILFGNDFVKNSIKINNSSNNYKLKGTISNNKYYKGNRSMQFIYVNGRYIKNDAITEAIETAYHKYIPNGRFPLFEIKLNVNPNLIDINIHPNKQKIKFSFNDELLELINTTISNALFDSENSKNIEVKEKKEKILSFYDYNQDDSYKKILDKYKKTISVEDFTIQNKKNEKINNNDYIRFIDDDIEDINIVKENKEEYIQDSIENNIIIDNEKIKEYSDFDFKTIIFNKFILLEKNNLLKFIDIDGANKRILFDKLNINDDIHSQILLEAIIIELSSKDFDIFISNKEKFIKLGYDVDVFGENNIAIRAIPYYLNEPSTANDFKMLLDNINNNEEDKNKHFIRKITSLAINKNKVLNKEQSMLLFKELIKLDNPYTDPSGNTIIYDMTLDNFIKILKR